MATEAATDVIRRIVVATDFSPRSDRALRRATLVAKHLGSSLSLVHVVDAELSRRVLDAERTAAEQVLQETVATIRDVDGVAADAQVVVDDIAGGILSAAREVGADLIVLGPHRSRFRDVFTGTTVERVVRHTDIAVLVALQPPSGLYNRTMLAIDFAPACEAAVRGALRMGLFDRTQVTLAHAFDPPGLGMMKRSLQDDATIDDYVRRERSAALARLDAFSAELGLPPTQRHVDLVGGTAAQSILTSAHDLKADLVVTGTPRKGSARRLLIGSVAEQIVRDAERDILVIPADGGPAEEAGG